MEVFKTIGRRKTSIARIVLKSGNGIIQVNNVDLVKYFSSEILRIIIKRPLNKISLLDKFDIFINVKGGGLRGQSEAIQLAISRALCIFDNKYRKSFKKDKFLTRDSRVVERKKSGKKKSKKKFSV